MSKVKNWPVYFAMVENGVVFQRCLGNGRSGKRLMKRVTDWILRQGFRPVAAVSNPEKRFCRVFCIPSSSRVNDDLMMVVTVKIGEEEEIAGYKLVPGLRKKRNLYKVVV